MILSGSTTANELIAYVSQLRQEVEAGNGIAAFKLSLVYSPSSVLSPAMKTSIGASEKHEREWQVRSIPLLENMAHAGDSEAEGILEIYRKGFPDLIPVGE